MMTYEYATDPTDEEIVEEYLAQELWRSRCRYYGLPMSQLPEDERAEYLRHQARAMLDAIDDLEYIMGIYLS